MTRTSTFVMCGALVIVVGGTLVGGCIGDREMATSASAVSSEAAASDGVSETGAGATTDASTSISTGEPVPTTSTSTGSSGEATTGFIVTPDGGGGVEECDVFAQDCEEGEKCAPWADGGGSAWNATKCVPVMGDQKPGEPCTAVGGGVSGLDDCIKGAMCWDVDAKNQGECIALCVGDESMPVCADPNAVCSVSGEGVLNICLPTCEPLIQDCAGDDLCLPVAGTYFCVLDASGDLGANFDPCEYANACDKGLVCLGPQAATECDQMLTGCCLPMCSIEGAGAECPGAGQKCLAVYEPQPPGFEDVGYCSLQ